ncbi:MAG: ATP-binding cassette domain-containing protein [Pseudomonadota bacterium]
MHHLGPGSVHRPEQKKDPNPLRRPGRFKINDSEIVFIIGGNGSGKSTVLRLLTGLYPTKAGTISINDTPIVGQKPSVTKSLQMSHGR